MTVKEARNGKKKTRRTAPSPLYGEGEVLKGFIF